MRRLLPLLLGLALVSGAVGSTTPQITAGTIVNLVVTVGFNSPEVGWNEASGPMGSINTQALPGAANTLHAVESIGGSLDFIVHMNSNGTAQNYFKRVIVSDGNGAKRVFETASATSFINNSGTRWIWGTGSSMVWASTDSGEAHVVQLVF